MILETLYNIYKIPELRRRALFTLGMLAIYRFGSFVPVPGIDTSAMLAWMESQNNSLLSLYNMFSGGALAQASVFTLGVMPYITASIMFQMLTVVSPTIERLGKEGAQGRKRLNQYTRYLTIVLASLQGIGAVKLIEGFSHDGQPIVPNPGLGFTLIAVLTMVTGTVVIMWIGEKISERGIGNGISLIIYAGIIIGLPSAIVGLFIDLQSGDKSVFTVLTMGAVMLLVTAFVVFMERAIRKVAIQYARRSGGAGSASMQRSYMPLKVNMGNVMPIIFASTVFGLPNMLGQFLGEGAPPWFLTFMSHFQWGDPLNVIFQTIVIVFFTFFYVSIIFNPAETAENLQKSNAFIPNIRAGEETASYLDGIVSRLTFWGALYLAAVNVVPIIILSGIHLQTLPYIGDFINQYFPKFILQGANVQFYFGGTSLIIVVGVAIDLVSKIEGQLLMHNYEGIITGTRIKERRSLL